MGKSSLAAFLSLLLIAAASPSFAHTSGTEIGSAPRVTPVERTSPVVARDGRVGALRSRPKGCNYRGGPKTGMWSCEQTYELMNGGSLR